MDSITFGPAGKQDYAEYERHVWKGSIVLTLIKTVLASAIGKMQLAVALPSLISDPELPMVLTANEINIINVFFHDIDFYFKYSSLSASKRKGATSNTYSKTVCCITSRFGHAVQEILKILGKHIDVLHMDSSYRHISAPSALFLRYIRYFLEQHILERMCLMPEQARNREVYYRKLWRCQKKSIGKINCYTKYEKKQLILHDIWEFEQNETQSALENVLDDLISLKQTNTKLEQSIRERRSMSESKLLAVMTKYDIEIGSRCRMLEEFNKTYKNDRAEKCKLKEEMKRQEALYATYSEAKGREVPTSI